MTSQMTGPSLTVVEVVLMLLFVLFAMSVAWLAVCVARVAVSASGVEAEPPPLPQETVEAEAERRIQAAIADLLSGPPTRIRPKVLKFDFTNDRFTLQWPDGRIETVDTLELAHRGVYPFVPKGIA